MHDYRDDRQLSRLDCSGTLSLPKSQNSESASLKLEGEVVSFLRLYVPAASDDEASNWLPVGEHWDGNVAGCGGLLIRAGVVSAVRRDWQGAVGTLLRPSALAERR